MKIWIPFVGKVSATKLFLGLLSVSGIFLNARAQSAAKIEEVTIDEAPIERVFGSTAIVTNKIQTHETLLPVNVIPQPAVSEHAESYKSYGEYGLWIKALSAGFAKRSDTEGSELLPRRRGCLA